MTRNANIYNILQKVEKQRRKTFNIAKKIQSPGNKHNLEIEEIFKGIDVDLKRASNLIRNPTTLWTGRPYYSASQAKKDLQRYSRRKNHTHVAKLDATTKLLFALHNTQEIQELKLHANVLQSLQVQKLDEAKKLLNQYHKTGTQIDKRAYDRARSQIDALRANKLEIMKQIEAIGSGLKQYGS
jgi:hypothetical protein